MERKPFFQTIKKIKKIPKKTKNTSSKTRNKKISCNLIVTKPSISNIGLSGNLVNIIINSIYQTNLLSHNKKNIEYDKIMKTYQKFKMEIIIALIVKVIITMREIKKILRKKRSQEEVIVFMVIIIILIIIILILK